MDLLNYTKATFLSDDRSGMEWNNFLWPSINSDLVGVDWVNNWPAECLKFVVGSPSQVFNSKTNKDWISPEDQSIWVRTSWNEVGVIIGIEVIDRDFDCDCKLIYCLGASKAKLLSTKALPHECTIRFKINDEFASSDQFGDVISYDMKVRKIRNGIAIQSLIPWEVFGGNLHDDSCFFGVKYLTKKCTLSWKRARYEYFGPLMYCHRLVKPNLAMDIELCNEELLLIPSDSGSIVYGFEPVVPDEGINPYPSLPYARNIQAHDIKMHQVNGWPILHAFHAGQKLHCILTPTKVLEFITEQIDNIQNCLSPENENVAPQDNNSDSLLLLKQYRKQLSREISQLKQDFTCVDMINLRETAQLVAK